MRVTGSVRMRAAGSSEDRALRNAAAGGFRILLADGLFIPTALFMAAYLARRLGPFDYGLYVLAAAFGGWLEWLLSAAAARAVIRLIAQSADWRAPAAAALKVLLALACTAGMVLWVCARPLGSVLGAPPLAPLLRLTALAAPLVGLVLAHRFILIGLERFGHRAAAAVTRSLGRLVLVIALVEAGFGVLGATAAYVGSMAVELLVVRCFVRPVIAGVGPTPWRELGRAAGPLFATGLSMRLLERADLFCLQAIGADAAATGLYGAAQNLAQLPGFVATAFTPVILASVTRLRADGRDDEAREVARHSLRAALGLVPLAAIVAASATSLVMVLYGAEYRTAGPLLTILSVASVPQVFLTLVCTLLIAVDRIAVAMVVVVPIVPLTVLAQALVIPHYGAAGAAVVTAATAALSAAIGLRALRAHAVVAPPGKTVAWAVGISVVAAGLAAGPPGEAAFVFARIAAAIVAVVVIAATSGEVPISSLRSLTAWGRKPGSLG